MGIDTGDIIAHARPKIEKGDSAHTVGCKAIKAGASYLVEVMNLVKAGKDLNRVKQWKVSGARYYRAGDFNEKILLKYKRNLSNGLVERYVENPKDVPKLIPLYSDK